MARSIFLILTVLVAVGGASRLLWTHLSGAAEPLTVADLLRHSHELQGKEITVKGAVTGSAGVLGFGAYRLHDKAGIQEILVASDHGIPIVGQEVTVSGMYVQAATFGDRQYGMVVPKDWCAAIRLRGYLSSLPLGICGRT